jgi:adenylylsulfate kinase
MNDDLRGLCLWFTGLSAAGKTTLCRAAEPELRTLGYRVRVLDAEELRHTVSRDLGFSKADRDENVVRIAALARDLVQQGYIVLVAAISPYAQARARARAHIGKFLEVYVDAPLELCIRRDPKGLYASALLGELPNVTGIDDPYEPPAAPDIHCHTACEPLAACVAKVLNGVQAQTRGPLYRQTRGRAWV